MKKLMALLTLGFVLAQVPAMAADQQEELTIDEGMVSSEAALQGRQDEHAFWKCSAQAPRLIRVYTLRKEGYRSDVQAEVLEECNSRSVLQCWPLGCAKLRR